MAGDGLAVLNDRENTMVRMSREEQLLRKREDSRLRRLAMGMKPRGPKLSDEEVARRNRESSRRYRNENRELVNAKNRNKSYTKNDFTPEQWQRKLDKQKEWRTANKDRYREKARERHGRLYHSDPTYREKCKAKSRDYCKTEKGRAIVNARAKNRKASDPAFAIACNARVKLNKFVSGKRKAGSFSKLFGCTKEMLLAHIESQFSEGMTWANRGIYWHLDHIMPLSLLDMVSCELTFRAANNYRNLRPMIGKENISKGNKVTDEMTEAFEKLKATIKTEIANEDSIQG